jgi:hypothetical protein
MNSKIIPSNNVKEWMNDLGSDRQKQKQISFGNRTEFKLLIYLQT